MASSTEAETRGTAVASCASSSPSSPTCAPPSALLGWDRETMMPARGAEARGEVTATLEQLAHERLADAELADLLEPRRGGAADDPDGQDARDRARRAARPRPRRAHPGRAHGGDGARDAPRRCPVWAAARARRRISPRFRPHLERQVALRREVAACFPDVDHPYDALLDAYEPGATTAAVREVFGRAARRPRPADRGDRRAPGAAAAAGPAAPSRASARSASRWRARIGYDDDGWRLDNSAHPFSISRSAPATCASTARWDEADLSGIFAVLHEVGHGLYEQQVEPGTRAHDARHRRLARRPRVAEPALGEPGRPLARPFWSALAPARAAGVCPALGGLDLDAFLRRVNVVRADAHPRRGRRGDLQPARHPALRARGGADRGDAGGRRPAGRLERADARPARGRRARRPPRRACRTSTGRSASSATSRRTRSATSYAAQLWRRDPRAGRPTSTRARRRRLRAAARLAARARPPPRPPLRPAGAAAPRDRPAARSRAAAGVPARTSTARCTISAQCELITRSISPYSAACSAVKKRSRSMSSWTCSIDWPVWWA